MKMQDFLNKAIKTEIASVLARCTDAQVAGFHRLFPKGTDVLNDEQLRSCLNLCWRTERSNLKCTTQ